MTVTTRGERELTLRFETFPERAREKLKERITGLTDRLEARIEAAAPRRRGRLATEIKSRVFADMPTRVAGYVQVYAPGLATEYPKAATLEYGTNKPRRIFARNNGVIERVIKGRRRLIKRVAGMTKQVHIHAFRYLRGPFDAIRPEVEAELAAGLAEVAQENNT